MNYSNLLIALGLVTMQANAGTSAPVETPPPAPEPSICEWFIGGTYGQMSNVDFDPSNLAIVDEIDLEMFSLHVGRGITNTNGWDFAAYLEVAYIHGDASGRGWFFDGEDSFRGKVDLDVEIIPVTLNFKVERQIVGPISAYLTGGAGYAWTKFEEGSYSHNDGGFYAQASAGLIWNVTESFEVYGGARWVYLDDLDLTESPVLKLDDAVAWEVGLRYNF